MSIIYHIFQSKYDRKAFRGRYRLSNRIVWVNRESVALDILIGYKEFDNTLDNTEAPRMDVNMALYFAEENRINWCLLKKYSPLICVIWQFQDNGTQR